MTDSYESSVRHEKITWTEALATLEVGGNAVLYQPHPNAPQRREDVNSIAAMTLGSIRSGIWTVVYPLREYTRVVTNHADIDWSLVRSQFNDLPSWVHTKGVAVRVIVKELP